MTTLKVIDDKNFIIELAAAVPQSEEVTHMGCNWSIKTAQNKKCFLTFDCRANDSNLWNINVGITLKAAKPDGSKLIMHRSDALLSQDSPQHNLTAEDFPVELKLEDIQEMKENPSVMEFHCQVKSSVGLHYFKVHNFEKMDENVNNTALIVEGRKLYVSKQILAMASPVFHAMFFSNFKESTANKIPIKDVKHADFMNLLHSIYGHFDINQSNITSLLQQADRFDVQDVMKKCEDYLVKNDDVPAAEKLILAENYHLSELQSKVLKSLTKAEIRSFGKESQKFGEATLRSLFKLASSFI